jgi:signal transduction histidine kinase
LTPIDAPVSAADGDRDRAGAEVDEALARLHKIASHVPGVLFQYQQQADGFGRFPYISERCAALFGLPPAAVMADASAMLRRIERSERQAVLNSIDLSAASKRPWVREFSLYRHDGAPRRIHAAATPQRESDGSTLWHGYFEDVTEAQALVQARHDKDLAEAANRSKTEFMSRMSHELRTPLNAVLGLAQLMEIDANAPLALLQRRRLALIQQSGEHLLALIGDLLDLTSIEVGRIPLTLEAVPLTALVDDALALVQAAARRPDVSLRRDAGADGQTLSAWADRKRLRQVLLNLLSNAVKYNRPDGSVVVQVDRVGSGVCLQVHDTGLGLTADECAHLFEPFNRLRQAQGEIEGTGIGLTVTQGLVALMGGSIQVCSTPGEGSSFSVWLPAVAARLDHAATAS